MLYRHNDHRTVLPSWSVAFLALALLVLASPRAAASVTLAGPVGDAFYFTADSEGHLGPRASHGNALEACAWLSRGTPEETFRLPGCGASGGMQLGDLLFYSSYVAGAPTRLWATDGTLEGTVLLASFPGPERRIRHLTEVSTAGGARLVFTMDDPRYGVEPWVTDGTPAGTHLLADVQPGPEGSAPWSLLPVGAEGDQELVFFTGESLEANRHSPLHVWRSDLTTDGTRETGVLPISASSPQRLTGPVALEDAVLLWLEPAPPRQCSPCRAELWRVGDASQPPRVLAETGPGEPSSSFPTTLQRGGDHVYFVRADEDGEDELWRTDGEGVEEVATPPASLYGVGLRGVREAGDAVIAILRSEANGQELWRIDGDGPQARLLRDLMPGPEDGLPTFEPGVVHVPGEGDWVLFTAYSHPVQGGELWRTDGTTVGTRRVQGLCSERRCVTPDLIARDDRGRLLVQTAGAFRTQNLNLVDLTDGSVEVVLPVDEHTLVPQPTLSLDGVFYFYVEDAFGPDLWRSDGTAEGTYRFLDLSPEPGPVGEPPAVPYAWSVKNEFASLPGFPPDRRLYWFDSADGGLAEEFIVEVRTPTSPGWTVVDERPSEGFGLHYHFLDLAPGTPASYRVRARNQAGTSAPSRELHTRILEADPRAQSCGVAGGLCLGDERYSVLVDFRNPQASGVGTPLPLPGSERTGLFSFFAEDNGELVVKVLDGGAVNGHVWLFSGSLTDVEYWLTLLDHATGRATTYRRAPGSVCGVTDTLALEATQLILTTPNTPAGPPFPPASAHTALVEAGAKSGAAEGEGCTPDATTLCLLDGRYAVTVTWDDQHNDRSGVGGALPLADRTGMFWFFRQDNVELVVKVLDGTPVNGNTWVFYGALTDVGYTLTVTDTATGHAVERYVNEPGNVCGGADTTAF